LLLCRMLTRSARPFAPSQMRSVLSRDVVSTRLDPGGAQGSTMPTALRQESRVQQQVGSDYRLHRCGCKPLARSTPSRTKQLARFQEKCPAMSTVCIATATCGQ
jgi:hypothetical protein